MVGAATGVRGDQVRQLSRVVVLHHHQRVGAGELFAKFPVGERPQQAELDDPQGGKIPQCLAQRAGGRAPGHGGQRCIGIAEHRQLFRHGDVARGGLQLAGALFHHLFAYHRILTHPALDAVLDAGGPELLAGPARQGTGRDAIRGEAEAFGRAGVCRPGPGLAAPDGVA